MGLYAAAKRHIILLGGFTRIGYSTYYFSHTVHCYNAPIHPLPEPSLLVPVSLSLPSLKARVCSDWLALTGLSSAGVFATTAV